jgi:predicted nucleic acid-binding protein
VRRVFVDTGGFFGLIAAEDAVHERAVELFTQADRERWHLITTNAIVYETHALLLTRARQGRTLGLEFLEAMGNTRCRIERIRKRDEARAKGLLRAHRDKGYSFCDALSFTVMDRLGIKEVIAFDRHFREYGRLTIL